ncbi:hypothetical protein F4810DRAFT_375050 [Camillea tinctor]|nr:hypothetical protein F4810DRAFT_375050 [Camillea tinctor]
MTETLPVLRLWRRAPTELIQPRQKIKQPDGPWIAHPGLIHEKCNEADGKVREFRHEFIRKDKAYVKKILAGRKLEDLRILAIVSVAPVVNMAEMHKLGKTDSEIALAVEKHYVNTHVYLNPILAGDPSSNKHYGVDWGLNARGIYYRHYYSPGWVIDNHNLWLPSHRVDWDHCTEESRRERARTFLRHVLDNERWPKSEYAWEADAWQHVFGQMRNDPVLAVDKHEYNSVKERRHPVSCLLDGDPKFTKRIPDATFGLATSRPQDYRNCLGEYNLDRDRLEALLLHRDCGLISDPHWGDENLVFPFAVYEAKGWSGDPREARQQACSAGAAYLDLLDNLARQPDSESKRYQTQQSRNTQVFVFTSFGAHWHILVGYKRPRLKREYAGLQGMSESVYVFQRIWSDRITTERKAWELLSFVDQIHLWGVTGHRDFVIQHLKEWHEFGRECYADDVHIMNQIPQVGKMVVGNTVQCMMPSFPLPKWTEYFTEEARDDFESRSLGHIYEAFLTFWGDPMHEFPGELHCQLDGCRPGVLLETPDEVVKHLREVHPGDGGEEEQAELAWYSH